MMSLARRPAVLSLVLLLSQSPATRLAEAQCLSVFELNRFLSSRTNEAPGIGTSIAATNSATYLGASSANSRRGPSTGSVLVFEHCPGEMLRETELIGETSAHGDAFGFAVSADGDTVAVGSPYHGGGGQEDVGAVHVFVRAGTGWRQQAILQASNRRPHDHFGWAVAICGDWILVGAPGYDAQAQNHGATYFFHRNGGVWREAAFERGTVEGGEFGFSVAIDQNEALIGARTSGSVRHRTLSNATWQPSSALLDPRSDSASGFGHSVALQNGWAIVGAPEAMTQVGARLGAVFLFERDSEGWREAQIIESPPSASLFGWAVSLSAPFSVVGAPSANGRGSAWLLAQHNGDWGVLTELDHGSISSQARFGWSVLVSGDRVLVGAPGGPSVVVGYDVRRDGPEITREPDSVTFCRGTTIAFFTDATTVGATSIRWRRDDVPISDGPTMSGAEYLGTQTPHLTIANCQVSDSGRYDCMISDACGQTISRGALATSCEATSDFQCDGVVDLTDLSILLGQFGEAGSSNQGDVDGNGLVDLADLSRLLAEFGERCLF